MCNQKYSDVVEVYFDDTIYLDQIAKFIKEKVKQYRKRPMGDTMRRYFSASIGEAK